ncbi:cupredoxin domain-containing protein [Paramagnetospirillum kuznetsovii]|nr:cupredoxin domain-containing protein [Paramagnetospirillum kuznetsovii]
MRRFLLALPFALAACAGSDVISPTLPPNYLSDAPRILAATDWSNPDSVTVTMTNFEFSPSELNLRRDRAVRLVFVNPSTKDHTVVSDQFFREVATRQVVGPNGATAAPWLSKLVVPSGETKEIWLVPARYGAYHFQCDVTGHSALGMNGIINVIP